MTDLVERLRLSANPDDWDAAAEIERLIEENSCLVTENIENEAEIARLMAERDEGARWRRDGEAQLRAEIERLKAALKAIAWYKDDDPVNNLIRAALEPKP